MAVSMAVWFAISFFLFFSFSLFSLFPLSFEKLSISSNWL